MNQNAKRLCLQRTQRLILAGNTDEIERNKGNPELLEWAVKELPPDVGFYMFGGNYIMELEKGWYRRLRKTIGSDATLSYYHKKALARMK